MKEKHKRISITIDKSIYSYLKEHKIKVSTYINQSLRVALFGSPTSYTPYTTYTKSQMPGKLESQDYASSNLVLCV